MAKAMTYSEQLILVDAISHGRIDILKTLFGPSQLDVNDFISVSGSTALDAAALFKQLDVVKFLLALPGININAVNRDGRTALHTAAFVGHADIVSLLLKSADILPNAIDSKGYTALHLAALHRADDVIISMGLDSRVDPNVLNARGNSALREAEMFSQTTTVASFLTFRRINIDADQKVKLYIEFQIPSIQLLIKSEKIQRVLLLLEDLELEKSVRLDVMHKIFEVLNEIDNASKKSKPVTEKKLLDCLITSLATALNIPKSFVNDYANENDIKERKRLVELAFADLFSAVKELGNFILDNNQNKSLIITDSLIKAVKIIKQNESMFLPQPYQHEIFQYIKTMYDLDPSASLFCEDQAWAIVDKLKLDPWSSNVVKAEDEEVQALDEGYNAPFYKLSKNEFDMFLSNPALQKEIINRIVTDPLIPSSLLLDKIEKLDVICQTYQARLEKRPENKRTKDTKDKIEVIKELRDILKNGVSSENEKMNPDEKLNLRLTKFKDVFEKKAKNQLENRRDSWLKAFVKAILRVFRYKGKELDNAVTERVKKLGEYRLFKIPGHRVTQSIGNVLKQGDQSAPTPKTQKK